jgi:hypothetical protein
MESNIFGGKSYTVYAEYNFDPRLRYDQLRRLYKLAGLKINLSRCQRQGDNTNFD